MIQPQLDYIFIWHHFHVSGTFLSLFFSQDGVRVYRGKGSRCGSPVCQVGSRDSGAHAGILCFSSQWALSLVSLLLMLRHFTE